MKINLVKIEITANEYHVSLHELYAVACRWLVETVNFSRVDLNLVESFGCNLKEFHELIFNEIIPFEYSPSNYSKQEHEVKFKNLHAKLETFLRFNNEFLPVEIQNNWHSNALANRYNVLVVHPYPNIDSDLEFRFPSVKT